MGFPAMSSSGFPGKRLEAKRAGIIATVVFWGLFVGFEPV